MNTNIYLPLIPKIKQNILEVFPMEQEANGDERRRGAARTQCFDSGTMYIFYIIF